MDDSSEERQDAENSDDSQVKKIKEYHRQQQKILL